MTDGQQRRRLRREAKARVDGLDIPVPFDVAALCARLAARRGRRIVLQPQPMGAGPTGMWVDAGGIDYIVYERETTPLHQEQIILHEVGHLVSEHGPPDVSDEEAVAVLMPDLDLDMVRRVMSRHGYTSEQEEEAELVASLVLERAGRTRSRTQSHPATPEAARAVDVLGSLLRGGPR